MKSLPKVVLAYGLYLLTVNALHGSERVALRGHVPKVTADLQPLGRLAATNRLHLAIGLPLHNPAGLAQLLRQLYDPSNPGYRRYLTPAQFTDAFGPTDEEYQSAIAFARAHGLVVTQTHPNRVLVDVEGAVADIEAAFGLNLLVYQHPKEARTFYAPDAEPSVDKNIRLLHISGLDNYTLPHPLSHEMNTRSDSRAMPRAGSGPSGSYRGNDFRNAYVPGLALTGTGQTVGLFEFDGFYASDIASYESQAGLPNVTVNNVLVDGFNGVPSSRHGVGNEEVALDIEVTISMAPGLSAVLVYEGPPTGATATANDILNRMATDNQAHQLSCSWGFDIDVTTQQIFQQFAAQGQSFFVAAGDSGAFSNFVDQPADDPYITVVGGTSLITDSSQAWVSETDWNGSGGGISSIYPIPDWQLGINMSANHGSTSMRNIPDVAMLADNVWEIANDGQGLAVVGTSIATPLWAAFTALVNEQAAASGKPPVGFLNPALYAIGKGTSYTKCFHDITTGNNTNSNSPSLFFATTGYDLCTGFGTPNGGTSLINALLAVPSEALLIQPPLGFISEGPVGGPFNITSQTYTLTNAGSQSLMWSLASPSSLVNVSQDSGTLVPGGPATTVTVTLNSADNSLLLGNYNATVFFTNLTDGVQQNRPFTLLVGNPGFETGDFTDWDLSGDTNYNFADSVDSTDLYGASIPGVNDFLFVHSGIYGAFLGQTGSLGYLSQTLPTTPGQSYVLSFWLDNPASGTPNEFSASWNGTTLLDEINVGPFAWTNFQYLVSATAANTVLQFGFRNDQVAFGLDDISVQPVPQPVLQNVTQSNGVVSLSWSSVPGVVYQVQYTDNLPAASWNNLRGAVSATGNTLSATDSALSSPQRFYRLVLPHM